MLKKLFLCLLYLFILGMLSLLVGRILPKSWFLENSFPYRLLPFEKEGRIYKKININRWQNKIPDMSKILPKLMPKKSLEDFSKNADDIKLLITESCIAECIHGIVCIAGFYCMKIWSGFGGVFISLLAFAVNLIYIIIQRYNRPRLIQLYERLKRREGCRVEEEPIDDVAMATQKIV